MNVASTLGSEMCQTQRTLKEEVEEHTTHCDSHKGDDKSSATDMPMS